MDKRRGGRGREKMTGNTGVLEIRGIKKTDGKQREKESFN